MGLVFYFDCRPYYLVTSWLTCWVGPHWPSHHGRCPIRKTTSKPIYEHSAWSHGPLLFGTTSSWYVERIVYGIAPYWCSKFQPWKKNGVLFRICFISFSFRFAKQPVSSFPASSVSSFVNISLPWERPFILWEDYPSRNSQRPLAKRIHTTFTPDRESRKKNCY